MFDVIQSEEALQKQVHLNGQLPANVISLFDSVVVVVVGAVSEKVMTILAVSVCPPESVAVTGTVFVVPLS